MTIRSILFMAAMLLAVEGECQTKSDFSIDLWPDGLPNSNGIDKTKPFDDATQNFKPNIRVFLPEKPDGRAVIACPGGGYSHLAMDHEGYDWAPFFNSRGIALIVVKYRMPHNNKEVPMSDVEEAFRYTRNHAREWNINPHKIGIMGSSAGGHLASTIATHSRKKVAPAFQILFYPVISMKENLSHKGSCVNFMSKHPSKEEIDLYSNEKQVGRNTPPAIVLLSQDDRVVPPENGGCYVHNINVLGGKARLCTYPSGGHGWGFRTTFAHNKQMLSDLSDWLEGIK